MSIIMNRPIVILEDTIYNNFKFYKKFASFINTKFEKLNIDNIIYINFINKNHYQILTKNKSIIKNRINKITVHQFVNLLQLMLIYKKLIIQIIINPI